MPQLTTFETWYGRNTPPPTAEHLRAGRLEVDFQDGDLRALRFGGRELVRRIYMAVRDVNWNTIAGEVSGLAVERGTDSFRVTYTSAHHSGPLQFRWTATLTGGADGTLELAMDGVAESDFRYNRIGFCLLHPIQGIAGRPYQAETPGGTVRGVLPELIEPQRLVDGFEAPVFPSFSSLSIDLGGGLAQAARFEGDLFEMEDQRNWTDGSFKTYGTPLSLGYPHQARAGQVFHQKITLKTRLPEPAAAGLPSAAELPGAGLPEARGLAGQGSAARPVELVIGEATGATLPQLGFGVGARSAPHFAERLAPLIAPRIAPLLAPLHPDHLKTEVHFKERAWASALEGAAAFARQVGSPLELALFLSSDPEGELESLAPLCAPLCAPTRVARVIVFHEDEAARGCTAAKWLRLARARLAAALPGVPILGGTNGNFAQLNRDRPDSAALAAFDGLSYTINPQVHAFDERSLVEAMDAQRDTVLTAHSFSGGTPVSISGVTLKPPFNVVAKEEDSHSEADCHCERSEAISTDAKKDCFVAKPPRNDIYNDTLRADPSIDPRQASLFGAAWTVGSIRALAEGGARSVTYYEASGPRGLMAAEGDSPLPGMLYPVYWVFAFLAAAKGAALLRVRSSQPLLAHALALKKDGRVWLLVSNYQPAAQSVRLSGLPGDRAAWSRLNEDTFMLAASDAQAFAGMKETLAYQQGAVTLALKPYETALIEI
jgi:D-apionolactonase